MVIEIIEEQVKMVIAKPQDINSVDVRRRAKKKMQKRDAKKKINRSCSTAKTVQPVMRRAKKRIPFRDEETRAILHGYSRFHYAWNKWARIRDYYWVFKGSRTSVQIKDRYRTMAKNGLIQLDQSKNIILQGVDEPESMTAAKRRLGRI